VLAAGDLRPTAAGGTGSHGWDPLADGKGGWTPIAHQVASFVQDHTKG
jgi:hypothetical protein